MDFEIPQLRDGEIILRPPGEGDVDARMSLESAPEIVRMFGGSKEDVRPITRPVAESWVARLTAPDRIGWIVEVDGQLVGSARLDGVDMRDRRATYAVGIIDPSLLGRGLGTRITRLVLDWAFSELGLHRIGLRVIEYNERGIACYRKCGFVEEGREREAALVDGERHDDILMGVLAKEYSA